MTRPDIEGIDALFAKAPQGKLFETDKLPYLHFAKDGIDPPAPDKVPHAFPVYGRFDYGEGAKDFVKEIHNNWPAIREYIAELEKDAGRLREENDKMREIIAASNLPCVYCGLPADQWLQCSSGFPGCARGDDAMCGPNQGLSKQEQEKQ